jgi:peptidoglycan/LPS O-acetylase OafA/YrhL
MAENELKSRYDDALRGIAALSVVFWHWQWLYSPPGEFTPPVDPSIQPFFWLLAPLYRYGVWGVEMFFSISGFVFFYLYADAIAQRRVTLATFANYRFSRLYPLHLLTLLIVAALQAAYFSHHAAFFIYQINDLRHFIMQLFFASNWSPRSPYSFNGPIWSLSIEVMLYAMFFVLALARLTYPVVIAALALVGALIIRDYAFIGHGMLSFFSGGLCFYLVRRWRTNHQIDWTAALSMAAVIIGATVIQRIKHGVGLAETVAEVIAFPAIIVALSMNEDRLKPIMSRLRWLGNISYSSYLIHFPLALLLVTTAGYLGIVVNPSAPWLLLAYLLVLMALSLLSFHYFEAPTQRLLRALAKVKPALAEIH